VDVDSDTEPFAFLCCAAASLCAAKPKQKNSGALMASTDRRENIPSPQMTYLAGWDPRVYLQVRFSKAGPDNSNVSDPEHRAIPDVSDH
jgi:hypothetical protein